MRRFTAILVLILLSLSLKSASGSVTSVEVSPSNLVRGDVLTIDVKADPGEQVNFQIRFKKDLPVTEGSYLLELSGVDIPQRPNSFTVKASNVKNLVVAVRLGIWISMSKDAVNGVASISQSEVPSGSYDTQIKGDAAAGAGTVTIEVTAKTTVTMDGEGHYQYSYDTSSIPAGTFNVNVGGVSKTITLSEAGTVVPPVISLIPPLARFNLAGEAFSGRPLTFDASPSSDADGTIVEYSWEMGDGATVNGRTVTHTYAEPGQYTVVLTVKDNHGLTGSWVELLNVQEAPNVAPVPVLTTSRRCFTGQLAGFSAYASYDPDGQIVSYRWDFGDGSVAEGVAVNHRYTSLGHYNLSLVVTDDDGLSSELTVHVDVVDLPNSLGWLEVTVKDGDLLSLPDIGASLHVNASEATTILVFQYVDNPHPEYSEPPGHTGPFIDVSVGDPDLIRWPLYIELRYNKSQVPPEDERRLGLFHFDDGWTQCKETGVNPGESYVWARLHRDELGGSPLAIGLKSSLEGATLRNLILSAEEAAPGDEVEVTVDVLSISDKASSYTLILEINGAPHSLRTVYLEPGESKQITWTVSFQDPGEYQLRVGDHVKTVYVSRAALPDMEISATLPVEAVTGQELTINFTVRNQGEAEAPMFNVTIYYGEIAGGSQLVGPLQVGESHDSSFSWVPPNPGEYTLRLVVDEEGKVKESFRDNNEFQATFTVREFKTDSTNLMLMFGLLFLILLSVLVTYSIFKRRHT